MKSSRKNIYIVAANNLSRLKAYEFANENGFEVVGQSGYIKDAAIEIVGGDVDTIICAPTLLDGKAKQLYSQLPNHIKNKCNFFVITPGQSNPYKLKKLSYCEYRQKDDRIESALNYLSMPKHLMGYDLFIDALNIALSTPDALSNLTRKIYSTLAKTHNTNTDNVEYNLRNAKDHSLNRCNPDIINEIFGEFPVDKPPTVADYLSKLTYYISHNKF